MYVKPKNINNQLILYDKNNILHLAIITKEDNFKIQQSYLLS